MRYSVGVWINVPIDADSEEEAKEVFLDYLRDGSIDIDPKSITVEEDDDQED